MSLDRIDFISAYCDSWCERCAFSERCSNFAVRVAVAMCDGDFEAAIELAVGTPARHDGEHRKTVGEQLTEEFWASDSDKEMEDISRELEERDARVYGLPLSHASSDYGIGTHRWLQNQHRDDHEVVVREALDVIGWDSLLIGAKLHRALNGLDEFDHGEAFEDDPVQNDWNGSAKVALISIERSLRAWETVCAACHDDGAEALLELLRSLATAVRARFPDAMRFRRPGFDAIPPED